MTKDNIHLSKAERLIGQLAWIALKELKNLSAGDISLVKFGELKAYMVENLNHYPFKDSEYARKLTKEGKPTWLYQLRWAGTVLKNIGYKTGPIGYWEITEQGEEYLKKCYNKQTEAMIELGLEARKVTKKSSKKQAENKQQDKQDRFEEPKTRIFDEEKNKSEIVSHIEQLLPSEFQDLVSILFQSMGYTVSYIAKPTTDGGIDLIAHKDPIGVQSKVLKIQVKHSQDITAPGIGSAEIRSLNGLCQSDNSHGVFVSVRGFSLTAENDVRRGLYPYITLIDLSRFIELWVTHLEKIPLAGKTMLPLKRVYVLDTGDR